MASNYSHVEHLAASKTYRFIDRGVQSIGPIHMEMENAAVAATPSVRLARLANVYGGIKPLLTVIAALPLIPQSWRLAVVLFMSTIEAVIAVTPQLGSDDDTVKIDDPNPSPVFKAGKDLDK